MNYMMEIVEIKYNGEINLYTFCKQYGYETIIPVNVASAFLQAYTDGIINKKGLNDCIEKWLNEIEAVGVINGKPFAIWKKYTTDEIQHDK